LAVNPALYHATEPALAEAEIRAADVENASTSDADDFVSAGAENGTSGQISNEAGGWGHGDPDVVANGVGRSVGSSSRFRVETDKSGSAETAKAGAVEDGGDAAIMRSLFGGGDGDGGTIRGAMNHDAIMGAAGGGKDHLTGHHTRVAAERAARQAAEAVHQSGRRGRTNVAVPTWTGRSGAAGAPPGATGRFGRAPLGARAGAAKVASRFQIPEPGSSAPVEGLSGLRRCCRGSGNATPPPG
jgi:DNA excision repair protein ERCC-6